MYKHQIALPIKQPERKLTSTTTVAMTEGSNIQHQAVLRPKQSASYLAVSIATIWRLVKAGELKTIKLSNRCTGILKSDLDAYLNR